MLYGTTAVGGVFSNGGTVFRMALDGSAYQHLHSFFGVGDGFNPAAGLIEAFDGTLFGTTVYGGEGFRGTIFQLAPDGTGYAVLYSFTGGSTDGANPYPGLIQDQDGVLYGTTFAGGAINFGVVFQLTIGQ